MNGPKLRFKADDGNEFCELEEKPLKDVADHYGGTALESFMDKNGTHKFISIGNYSSDGHYIDNGNRINAVGRATSKQLNKNDLVMVLNDKTSNGTILGSTILIDNDNYIYNQRSERIVCKNGLLPKYAWYILNSPSFKNQILNLKQGATQIYVNFKDVCELKLGIPCPDEQQKIADFFSTLDQIIDKTQAELDAWEKQKQGLMQKLFSQEIRFKADDGSEFPEWGMENLREITSPINRKADKNSNAPVMMISQGSGFIYQSDKYSRENAGQSLKNYTLLKRGEFAYNHGASKKKPYGVTYILSEESEARIPYVYHCFSMNSDEDGVFWNYAFNTSNMDRQLKKLVSSGVRMDGLLNISYEAYMSVDIMHPCKEEQHKIADCLSAFDSVIDKTQKELEAYKQLKKGLMQNMFV